MMMVGDIAIPATHKSCFVAVVVEDTVNKSHVFHVVLCVVFLQHCLHCGWQNQLHIWLFLDFIFFSKYSTDSEERCWV